MGRIYCYTAVIQKMLGNFAEADECEIAEMACIERLAQVVNPAFAY